LHIGAIPTLSPYLIPLVVVPLHHQYPQIKLILYEEVSDSLLRRLRGHELDAVLLATLVEEPDLATIPLFREPFWLAHPRNHPLYTKDEITREDLEHLELLLLADAHCLTRQVLDFCGLAERPVKEGVPELRAASLETLLQLVGAGFGCTLVPALAIRGPWMTDTGVIARPLAIADAYRDVSLVFRRSFPRRPVLDAFVQVLRKSLPNTVKPAFPSAPLREREAAP
jgi:LysR family hydrogen peroxide-inducible transcriptional activator